MVFGDSENGRKGEREKKQRKSFLKVRNRPQIYTYDLTHFDLFVSSNCDIRIFNYE